MAGVETSKLSSTLVQLMDLTARRSSLNHAQFSEKLQSLRDSVAGQSPTDPTLAQELKQVIALLDSMRLSINKSQFSFTIAHVNDLKARRSTLNQAQFSEELQNLRDSVVGQKHGDPTSQQELKQVIALLDSMRQSIEKPQLSSVLAQVKDLKERRSSLNQAQFSEELQNLRDSIAGQITKDLTSQGEAQQMIALLDSMRQSVEKQRVDHDATVVRMAAEIAKLQNDAGILGARIAEASVVAPTGAVAKPLAKSQGGKFQLAFVLDATSSMAWVIDEIKTSLCSVCHEVCTLTNRRVETALVVYRDHDTRSPSEKFDFGDPRYTQRNLQRVELCFSPDSAEAVLDGLSAATSLTWSPEPCLTKLILHCGDGPPHGLHLHALALKDDDFPDGHPDERHFESVMDEIGMKGISYTFLKISDSTNKMYAKFEDRLLNFDVDVRQIEFGSAAPAILAAVKATTCAVRGPASATPTVRRALKATPTCAVEFDRLPLHEVISYRAASLPAAFEPTLLVRELVLEDGRDAVGLADTPFAKGAERLAYCCEQGGRHLVAKCSLNPVPKGHAHSHYEGYLRMQVVASLLAQDYSRLRGRPNLIHYDSAFLVRKGAAYFMVEPYINGTYDKWSNNACGVWYVEDQEVHAFSHWTYVHTKKHLVVVDLQGVKISSERFHFTDPAVHTACTDFLPGATNLHTDGIAFFFMTHTCNDVCRALGLDKERP